MNEEFLARLKAFCREPTVRDVFQSHTGNADWDYGGCHALAVAVQSCLGRGELVGLSYRTPWFPYERIIGHVMLRLPEGLLDGNGLETLSVKRKRHEPSALPWQLYLLVPGDDEQFQSSPEFIAEVHRLLVQYVHGSLQE